MRIAHCILLISGGKEFFKIAFTTHVNGLSLWNYVVLEDLDTYLQYCSKVTHKGNWYFVVSLTVSWHHVRSGPDQMVCVVWKVHFQSISGIICLIVGRISPWKPFSSSELSTFRNFCLNVLSAVSLMQDFTAYIVGISKLSRLCSGLYHVNVMFIVLGWFFCAGCWPVQMMRWATCRLYVRNFKDIEIIWNHVKSCENRTRTNYSVKGLF